MANSILASDRRVTVEESANGLMTCSSTRLFHDSPSAPSTARPAMLP